jgi:radical SAM superfamily enzyme YgiQ (UPF0313 family)
MTRVEDNERAVIETMKAGIMCSTTWIICLPGETRQDAWKTVLLANKLSSHVAKFFLPVPFPGTELEKLCREDKGLREDARYEEYDLIMPQSLVYVNPLIGSRDMRAMLKAAYWKFYSNPKVLFKNAAMITDWDMVKKYWGFFKMAH